MIPLYLLVNSPIIPVFLSHINVGLHWTSHQDPLSPSCGPVVPAVRNFVHKTHMYDNLFAWFFLSTKLTCKSSQSKLSQFTLCWHFDIPSERCKHSLTQGLSILMRKGNEHTCGAICHIYGGCHLQLCRKSGQNTYLWPSRNKRRTSIYQINNNDKISKKRKVSYFSEWTTYCWSIFVSSGAVIFFSDICFLLDLKYSNQ